MGVEVDIQAFLDTSKKTQCQKTQAEKTQAEKKLKLILEKLKQIIQQLNNLPTKNWFKKSTEVIRFSTNIY